MPAPGRLDAKYCSGKAQLHTVKTQYATAHDGLILQTSTTVEESKYDLAVFKERVPASPENLPRR